MAISCQPGCEVKAHSSRLFCSGGCGISVLDESKASLTSCLIDFNSSGVSVNSGAAHLKDCVIHSNKLEGVGVSGQGSSIHMENCNIFNHKLNGIEIFNDAKQDQIVLQSCNVHDNLNGLSWWTPDDNEKELEALVDKENNIHDNRKKDIKIKQLKPDSSLVVLAVKGLLYLLCSSLLSINRTPVYLLVHWSSLLQT